MHTLNVQESFNTCLVLSDFSQDHLRRELKVMTTPQQGLCYTQFVQVLLNSCLALICWLHQHQASEKIE